MRLIASDGAVIDLGKELGRGGEGAVYEVLGSPSVVAKLYHQAIDAGKQAKLRFMADAADQQLLAYAAWPQKTLHKVRGGPVGGFLMPKVAGKPPIHEVYSPAHRRQSRPNLAWDYLLHAARNTAAAFESLHARGHLVGDVNHGNVLVGDDGRVTLIDCDSFQVNARGTLHLCEVGVPIFTAPELLGLPSFKDFARTTNHDNFGLALLIFHLLFGGRHPYAGVPLREDIGDSLEADIKHFRYAYARGGGRGKKPPPQSIPIELVPRPIENMFLRAFTEEGVQRGRPTAADWEASLDQLLGRLRRCSVTAMHLYPDHLQTCPWCQLEAQGVVYFIDPGAKTTQTDNGFVFERVWAVIAAVPAPSSAAIPNVASLITAPRPMPHFEPVPQHTRLRQALALMVVAVAVVGVVVFHGGPELLVVAALFVAGLWWTSKNIEKEPPELKAERKRRKDAAASAKAEFDRLCATARAPNDLFLRERNRLIEAKSEYEALLRTIDREIGALEQTARQRQEHDFLDRFFISAASIPNVGPAYKAALQSFGIETAADVEARKVRSVRGFGEKRTKAMLDWKKACLSQFRFDPRRATVTEADRIKLRARYATQLTRLVATLRSGEASLKQARAQVMAEVDRQSAELHRAARTLAQAQADLAVAGP